MVRTRPVPKNIRQQTFTEFFRQVIGRNQGLGFRMKVERIKKSVPKALLSYRGTDEKISRAAWNEFAKHWNTSLPFEHAKRVADHVLGAVRYRGDEHVLSIGSGGASVETYLAKTRLPKGRVVCVDFAHNINLEAQKIVQKAGAENVFFLTASATKIPLKENSQNVVILEQSVLFSDGLLPAAVSEIKRVIKPDLQSRVIFSADAQNTSQINQISSIFDRNGFDVVSKKVREFPGGVLEVDLVFQPRIRLSKTS